MKTAKPPLQPEITVVKIDEEEWYPVRILKPTNLEDRRAVRISTSLYIKYNNAMRQFEAAREELRKALK